MKTLMNVAAAAALAVLATACSTDNTTSYIDPDFQAGLPGDWRIVADGSNMDLNSEEALIEEAQKEFSKIGQTALSAIQIIPPTRDGDMTGEQRLAAYQKAGGEAVLEIQRLSKDVDSNYSYGSGGFVHGGGTSTAVVRERGLLQDGQIVSDRTTVVTTSYPAYYHDSFYPTTRTNAAYRARLIEVASGKVIWQADSTITRTTTRDTALVREAVEEFVDRLVVDGVMRDRKN